MEVLLREAADSHQDIRAARAAEDTLRVIRVARVAADTRAEVTRVEAVRVADKRIGWNDF